MKGLSQLMRQAQEMQANMQKAQDELAAIEVEGVAGGGMVKVVVTCKHEVRRVTIEEALLRDDKEMLEDLVAAAFNDANRKVEQTVQQRLSSVTGGLGLPAGLKLPFYATCPTFTRPLLNQLIEAFQCLPGVGSKTAQRMVFHLLDKDREGGGRLAATLERAVRSIRNCERCRMLTEEARLPLLRQRQARPHVSCASSRRRRICSRSSNRARTAARYFVLMGHLSPIDGIGPAELGLELLERRFGTERFAEIVLATSVTVEGDATAHLVAALAHKHGLRASRIAYGVPVGGELEYIDGGTLARALSGRRAIESVER